MRYRTSLTRLPFVLTCLLMGFTSQAVANEVTPQISVNRCDDFKVTGKGDSAAWQKADWVKLNRRDGGDLTYDAQIKMLYSETGVYVLFSGSDKKLTSTMTKDFADLWNEDVYECFFWTDEAHPIYFEYEISPLGYELPILVPNIDGDFLGWRPWHYEGERRIQKQVSAIGGPNESMANVSGWTAEVFIPYAVLKPLQNLPPKSGTKWRANFYRVDYDSQPSTAWDWSRVGKSFHEINKFGTLLFQ
ncbi:carbohydrate-binding family 9-like protein [Stieleria sp. JC731]|uniref:carbohydrate-binding family 9-like protein n=1 Tax=Pirellulaceae TaxID=2691357 RepID=UPI001E617029|nr:carbohydrate-binding family 9-like protein [Stieleria sp. JC731]MCC9600206.1 carbohydrate-binding family 9-like protein [Stieleria sp. JC731]